MGIFGRVDWKPVLLSLALPFAVQAVLLTMNGPVNPPWIGCLSSFLVPAVRFGRRAIAP